MALNIKPLFGPHYPFNHPTLEVNPEEEVVTPENDEGNVYGENLKRRKKLLARVQLLTEHLDSGDDDRGRLLRLLDGW